jgi:hypothetical protein
MHHFDRCSCADVDLIVVSPAGTHIPQVAERWSESLAAGHDESADFIDRLRKDGVEFTPSFRLDAE